MSGDRPAEEALSIRLAQPDDVATIHSLVSEAYGHYVARIGKLPGPMRDDYKRRIAAHQAWVAELDGEVIGLVVLEERPNHLLLDNVAVSPARQGQGFGRALIAFAEREARRRGFAQLELLTHERMVENIALYGRLGFREIGRVQMAGYERVSMGKPLP